MMSDMNANEAHADGESTGISNGVGGEFGKSQQSGEIPPGPRGLPLVGSTLTLARHGLAFSEQLHEYGDVVAYTAFGEDFVAIYDPELIESILVSRNDEFWKGDFEMAFGDLFAPNGLAFTEGDQWRRQRSALQPAFTPRQIQTHADSIVEETSISANHWSKRREIDLRNACSKLTLSILVDSLFDIDLDSDRGTTIRNAATAVGDLVDASGAAMLLPEWAPRTPTERRYDRIMAQFDDLISDLIVERREAVSEYDDLLTMLLDVEFADGSRMDESTVRDQLITFFFAGHETTSVALTYAIWLLSGNPSVRSRLNAELEAVSDGSGLTFADLPALETTEGIIKEALRLYPPIYSFYRQPRQDLMLGNFRISSDTTLQLATYNIQRDPRWWDNPDAFAPERWQKEDASRPEFAYLPFGGGPRHCIGMRFAMIELKLALATLAQHVEFERITDTITPAAKGVLDPGCVKMRVYPINDL